MMGKGQDCKVHTGNMPVLDLTLVSNNLAGICEWDVTYETSVGSDHYPVVCGILLQENKQQEKRIGKWIFDHANWEKFSFICESEIDKIDLNEDLEIDKKCKTILLEAANESIPKSN